MKSKLPTEKPSNASKRKSLRSVRKNWRLSVTIRRKPVGRRKSRMKSAESKKRRSSRLKSFVNYKRRQLTVNLRSTPSEPSVLLKKENAPLESKSKPTSKRERRWRRILTTQEESSSLKTRSVWLSKPKPSAIHSFA